MTSSPPSLAGVRLINALVDTGAIDIRMIDQIEWSALALTLSRSGTAHSGLSDSINPAIASPFLIDTTITVVANTNYTFLLVGTAGANTDRLWC